MVHKGVNGSQEQTSEKAAFLSRERMTEKKDKEKSFPERKNHDTF